MNENVKKNIENLIEGFDEFNSKYITYNAKVLRTILEETLSYIKQKEQECEELKKKKEENEKFYLTKYANKDSYCLELEHERNEYKHTLDDLQTAYNELVKVYSDSCEKVDELSKRLDEIEEYCKEQNLKYDTTACYILGVIGEMKGVNNDR